MKRSHVGLVTQPLLLGVLAVIAIGYTYLAAADLSWNSEQGTTADSSTPPNPTDPDVTDPEQCADCKADSCTGKCPPPPYNGDTFPPYQCVGKFDLNSKKSCTCDFLCYTQGTGAPTGDWPGQCGGGCTDSKKVCRSPGDGMACECLDRETCGGKWRCESKLCPTPAPVPGQPTPKPQTCDQVSSDGTCGCKAGCGGSCANVSGSGSDTVDAGKIPSVGVGAAQSECHKDLVRKCNNYNPQRTLCNVEYGEPSGVSCKTLTDRARDAASSYCQARGGAVAGLIFEAVVPEGQHVKVTVGCTGQCCSG